MEENNLKRHIFLILITLLLIATALKAGAEASKDENLSRYLGAWVSEEYRLYIRIEDDEVIARLTEVNGDYVWEFNRCFFDRDEGCLCGQNYVHYRQYIDWDVMELAVPDPEPDTIHERGQQPQRCLCEGHGGAGRRRRERRGAYAGGIYRKCHRDTYRYDDKGRLYRI